MPAGAEVEPGRPAETAGAGAPVPPADMPPPDPNDKLSGRERRRARKETWRLRATTMPGTSEADVLPTEPLSPLQQRVIAHMAGDEFGSRTGPDGLNTKIPSKVARYMRRRGVLASGEHVEAVLHNSHEAVIYTDRRLVVVKVGVLSHTTGGGRVTSFDYSEITAIAVQLGVLMGSLAVQSPGYGATQTGDFWTTRNQQDPLSLPNVIVWDKTSDRRFRAELAYAQDRISAAKQARHAPPPAPAGGSSEAPPASLAVELERLAALHAAGALDDDEFAAAKRRLLGA